MCGIVGLGDFRPRAGAFEHEAFLQMLVADALRGTHGTGMIKVYTNGEVDWRKMEGHPYNLFAADGVFAFINNHNKKDVRFLIGHNRSATFGDRSTNNAHPFSHGKITLVHNGTLEKHSKLDDFDKFSVDSEAICSSIDKVGIEKTINGIRGAYALVYYDDEKKQLNLIRNKERPLYLGVQATMGRIYFASEIGMLRWILGRNSMSDVKIEMIPEHQLITFNVNSKDNNGFIPKMRDLKDHVFSWSAWKDTFDSTSVVEKRVVYRMIGGVYQKVIDPEDTIPNGKVIALPPPKVTGKKQKKEEKKAQQQAFGGSSPFPPIPGTLTSIDTLFGYKKGGTIQFEIADYRENNKKEETYILEGYSNVYAKLVICALIKGEELLENVFASGTCRATVVSMQRNIDYLKGKDYAHRMWVTNVEPVLKQQEEDTAGKKPVGGLVIHQNDICDECAGLGGYHQAFCTKGDAPDPAEEAELQLALQEDIDVVQGIIGQSQQTLQ